MYLKILFKNYFLAVFSGLFLVILLNYFLISDISRRTSLIKEKNNELFFLKAVAGTLPDLRVNSKKASDIANKLNLLFLPVQRLRDFSSDFNKLAKANKLNL